MPPPNILIVYAGHDADGATATLAALIAQGAATRHAAVATVKRAEDATTADVLAADAVVLGSGVYNGDVEPAMLVFLDETIEVAGGHAVDLHTKVGGAFCTSASYVTGAQPTLNTMIRQLMTLGAAIVGSGSWHASQGVCGMVVAGVPPKTWDWAPGQPHLLEDAQAFGARIADVASFYSGALATATGQPAAPGGQIVCSSGARGRAGSGDNTAVIVLLCVGFAALLAAVLAVGLSPRRQW